MMIAMERILRLSVLIVRETQTDVTHHVSFGRDLDQGEDETLGTYMAALSVLFRNMEEDLGYGYLMAYERW